MNAERDVMAHLERVRDRCAQEPNHQHEDPEVIMTAPENESGEWTQPDPADVAAYDARMSAYAAQETARQQEWAAAARQGAEMAQQEHRATAPEFTSIAEQQQGQHDAEMEAGR